MTTGVQIKFRSLSQLTSAGDVSDPVLNQSKLSLACDCTTIGVLVSRTGSKILTLVLLAESSEM